MIRTIKNICEDYFFLYIGQQFEKVGIGIADCPAFAHGQSYVASSRARGWEFIKYYVRPGQTTMRNIVGPNLVDKHDKDAAKEAKTRFLASKFPVVIFSRNTRKTTFLIT